MRRWILLFLTCVTLAGSGAWAASPARAQDDLDDGGAETASPDEGAPNDGARDDWAETDAGQDDGAGDAAPGPRDGAGSGPAPASGPIVVVQSGDDEDSDDEEDEDAEPSPFDPHEREGDSLYHFGIFGRGIFAPQFFQNLFATGGTNALNAGAGVFFNYRRDGFNIMAEVWWAGFYATAPFHGLDETDLETEWLESELEVVFVSFAFMWSVPITSWLAFEIGLGLGFGGVFGGLWRTEAYPDRNSSSGWRPCNGPRDPNPEYCDAPEPSGEGSYDRLDGEPEPYNFAGSVPPIWLWLDLPRIALRIKPIRQLQIRVEAGIAGYAVHFGGSLAVGF